MNPLKAIAKRIRNWYEAARPSIHRAFLPGMVQDARFDANPSERLEILRKARYWECNSPIANRLADVFEQYTVGPHGLPMVPDTTDEVFNEVAQTEYSRWCEVPDLTSRMPMATIQSLAARRWFFDGEILIITTRGSTAPFYPRIQLVESHRVRSPDGADAGGATIVDGVELDAKGRPIAYWIQDGDSGSMPRRVDAESVIHIFEPSRPGRVRGISLLHAVLNHLQDLEELQMYEMLAAKNAAIITNVLFTEDGEVDADQMRKLLTPKQDSTATDVQNPKQREMDVQKAFPGRSLVLKINEKIEQFKSDRPNVTTRDYWEYLTSLVCIGSGISKQLVMPYSIQGTMGRADLDVCNSFFQSRSAVMQAAFRRVYDFWVKAMRNVDVRFANGPGDFWRVTTRSPRAVNVDVGYNSAAMIAELEAGVTTYDEIFSPRGVDWRDAQRRLAYQKKWIRELNQKLGNTPDSTPAPIPQEPTTATA